MQREIADDCEAMAKAAKVPEHVEALRRMAQTWRELAGARGLEMRRLERLRKQTSKTE